MLYLESQPDQRCIPSVEDTFLELSVMVFLSSFKFNKVLVLLVILAGFLLSRTYKEKSMSGVIIKLLISHIQVVALMSKGMCGVVGWVVVW